jgi:hypothetical protein
MAEEQAEEKQPQEDASSPEDPKEQMSTAPTKDKKKPKCWLVILIAFLLVAAVLSVFAWKTEYLDAWLPAGVREFFGRGEPSDLSEDEGEEGEVGEEEDQEEEEGEGEGLSPCGGAESKLESIDETWDIYYNCALGFSIAVPKEVKLYYGSCEWSEDEGSYRPKDAMVPTEVFEDNDSGIVYLGHEYYYELAGETVSEGVHYYSECNKVDNTLNRVSDEYLGLDRGQYQQAWKFVVETISDDAELDAFIKERYGDACGLGVKTLSGDQEGAYDVGISGEWPDCPINYGTVVKYHPTQNRLVAWDTGQAYTFYKVLGTGEETDIIYDSQIIDSFLFLD